MEIDLNADQDHLFLMLGMLAGMLSLPENQAALEVALTLPGGGRTRGHLLKLHGTLAKVLADAPAA